MSAAAAAATFQQPAQQTTCPSVPLATGQRAITYPSSWPACSNKFSTAFNDLPCTTLGLHTTYKVKHHVKLFRIDKLARKGCSVLCLHSHHCKQRSRARWHLDVLTEVGAELNQGRPKHRSPDTGSFQRKSRRKAWHACRGRARNKSTHSNGSRLDVRDV